MSTQAGPPLLCHLRHRRRCRRCRARRRRLCRCRCHPRCRRARRRRRADRRCPSAMDAAGAAAAATAAHSATTTATPRTMPSSTCPMAEALAPLHRGQARPPAKGSTAPLSPGGPSEADWATHEDKSSAMGGVPAPPVKAPSMVMPSAPAAAPPPPLAVPPHPRDLLQPSANVVERRVSERAPPRR